jgi:glucose/arabinose dehydrogenase
MTKTPVLLLLISLAGLDVHAAGEYSVATVAEGLEHPHAIAFLTDGDMLVTEKPGRLRLIRDGRLLSEPVSGVPAVYFYEYSGLLDIALHPRFAENRYVYLTLSRGSRKASSGHVVRGRYEAGNLYEVTEILTAMPSRKGGVFFGARMVFLPDETLLITVGDSYDYREEAQDINSTLGKILRVTDAGDVPPDNPFAGKANAAPEIWSYGHRDALGIIYDAVAGTVYCHENGPWGGDELNVIEPGRNYGWPIVTFGREYSGALVSPFQAYPGTEQPLLQWTPSPAPSGLTQCRGCQWPEWEGDLFAGALAGRQIKRVRLRENTVVEQQVLLAEIGERIRDVRFGPDGALYALTDSAEGRILRISATGGGTSDPE